jgi:UDP-N-acetylglucosamine--N-acetylmuramyl-(pentapeptide) pyrophosphoryl-undecaprenol N-acetylglucosamine transferase
VQRHSTILFAGGGSGGHLFPGIAVAEELRADACDTEIIFAGSERTIEHEIVAAHGYEHWPLPVESSTTIRRRPFRAVTNIWRSYSRARELLQKRRPDCVVGLGGFASVPVALAARRSRVPLVLLEQNVVPGRATTLLSCFADCVCLSFPQTVGPVATRQNAVVTGNPVRRNVAALFGGDPPRQTDLPRTLLVLGGSQGATGINDAMIVAARSAGETLGSWHIVHQTGPNDAARVRDAYGELKLNARVEAFFDDLTTWYRQAPLVVSRAGATTLAELACAGCPTLLIPYPHSLRNHQLANAQWFARRGAAVVVEQTDDKAAMAARLIEPLSRFALDAARREAMQSAMKTLARPAAAREVADCVRRHGR